MTDIPTIRLAGKDWPVPELAVFQLRKARSRIVLVNDALYPKGTDDAPVDWADKEAVRQRSIERASRASTNFETLNDEQYDALVDAVYYALLGANPKLTREEFDGLHISDTELFAAFFVVREQSGVYVLVKQAEASDAAGEAAAETASQTGTE